MSLGLGPQVLEPGIITLTELALILKAALMVETLKTKQCINLSRETRFQYIKGIDKKKTRKGHVSLNVLLLLLLLFLFFGKKTYGN